MMSRKSFRTAGLAGWLLFVLTNPASAFEAQIVDATTGRGIAGATVVLGGQRLETDAAGRFRSTETRGRIFARAPGYRAGAFDLGAIAPSDGSLRLAPFTPKAVYLNVYGIGSSAIRGAALALIHDEALNALVVDLKGDHGLVPYPSATAINVPGARQITTIPDLAALVRTLHNDGIYAIARIVTFRDEPLATSRPELAVRQTNGAPYHDRDGLGWTDPFQQAVHRYNIGIAVEAARAGFDEIQFDELRFPDAPQRLLFAARANAKERLAAISRFLAEARRELLPYNVYLSADILGTVCWNIDDADVGQRLEEIGSSVDYLSPKLDPSAFQFGIPGYSESAAHPYEIVNRSLETARLRLNVSAKRFRPWLQSLKDYGFDRRAFTAAEVTAQIKAATDFGSDGWMLRNPPNDYGLAGLGTSGDGDAEPQASALASSLSCS